jgi:16S rRNA (uracil1498-N3)-methyltransferase
MRLHRFYISQPLGEEVVIDGVSLVHQWMNVFRYKEGDTIILFNGDGYDYTYTITTCTKKSCTVIFLSKESNYIPARKTTLCLSLIKKDNFELVVQKATELGVTSIIPILAERSEKKNLSYERLEKIILEASEQSGRGDLVHVLPITSLKDVINSTDKEKNIVLTLDGSPLSSSPHRQYKEGEVRLFIGPEGGWMPSELQLMENAGFQLSSLGQTVLRAETAAIASVALLVL